jgi:hypothetical protein
MRDIEDLAPKGEWRYDLDKHGNRIPIRIQKQLKTDAELSGIFLLGGTIATVVLCIGIAIYQEQSPQVVLDKSDWSCTAKEVRVGSWVQKDSTMYPQFMERCSEYKRVARRDKK